MKNRISIVTPVYNRRDLVTRSINSSLKLINSGHALELIIVDDYSADDTVGLIKEQYSREISEGIIRLFPLGSNLGVTGAKNFGAAKSKGDYIVFMDSDDMFVNDAGKLIHNQLERIPNRPIYFFRCQNIDTGKLIGNEVDEYELTFKDYLNNGTPGECLPIINTTTFNMYPYEEALRGCEGTSYLKILKTKGSAYVSSEVVRGYMTEGDDRLSTRGNLSKRALFLFKYNIYLLRFFSDMTLNKFITVIAKISYYGSRALLNYVK